ncbi:JmjC domain-containing protein [Streptomyces tubercidicus]|uniref:JmjC domain-containing protein n=1 Tax=Streptomyces tubercidicus TaxID=47759 RepID=UPI00379FD659
MDVLRRFSDDTGDLVEAMRARTPTVFAPQDPPTDLLPLEELDDLLDGGLLRVPYVDVVTEGRDLPASLYCTLRRPTYHQPQYGYVDGHIVRDLVAAAGATLLLRYVDHWHPRTAALCTALESSVGRQVEAFYFVTPPGTVGRPVHRDDADVVVVQIAGAKQWWVHEPPASGDWEPGPTEAPGAVALAPLIRPGQVLLVPRGSAHRAEATGEGLSVHLSFTIRDAGAAQLLDALRSCLSAGAEPEIRPVDENRRLATAAELLDHARTALDKLTPHALLDEARRTMRPERLSRGTPLAGMRDPAGG